MHTMTLKFKTRDGYEAARKALERALFGPGEVRDEYTIRMARGRSEKLDHKEIVVTTKKQRNAICFHAHEEERNDNADCRLGSKRASG